MNPRLGVSFRGRKRVRRKGWTSMFGRLGRRHFLRKETNSGRSGNCMMVEMEIFSGRVKEKTIDARADKDSLVGRGGQVPLLEKR